MATKICLSGDEPVIGMIREKARAGGFEVVGDVRDADVAVTYCIAIHSLEDRYFDDGGLVRNARAGTLLVDLSPATPSVAREISAIAQVSDLRFVEAPLAVEELGILSALSDSSNVKCFAAGERADVDEARGLLNLLAAAVVRTGPAGSAQLAKARHTVRMVARLVGEVEADALARSAAGSAVSVDGRISEKPEPEEGGLPLTEALRAERLDGEYTVALLMADVAAAMTTADDAELILPQLESALHLLEVIAVIGGADMGVTALSLLYREEQASAEAGLDWSRAEGLFAASSADEGDEWEDEAGLPGAYGGYSFN